MIFRPGTLHAIPLALALGLLTQGCDNSTSSQSGNTTNPPDQTAKSTDTLKANSLTKSGSFATKGSTYYIEGGELSGDVVFGPKVSVVVLGTPHVSGSLTFLEGCNVYFEEGTYLDIATGRLDVLGSDSLPVLLKNRVAGKFWGYGASPSYSGGVWFSSSANSLSRIRYAVIDSANTGIYSNVDGIEISNSQFKHAKGYGVVFGSDEIGPKAGFSNDSFAGNKVGPILISASRLTRLDGSQKFAAGEPGIKVDGATVKEDGTWPALSVAYEILSAAKITDPSGVEIHIAAGTHLVYDQGSYLEVGESGTLKVDGTTTNPVVMGPAQTGKRWGYGSYDYHSGGIWIGSQASSNTTIRHLKLDSANTGIYVAVSGVVIDSSTFTNSQFQSILFDGSTVPGSLKGNTYANNGEYSIRLSFNGLTALDGSGTFDGAHSNVLVPNATASVSGMVPALPVPYEISGEARIKNSAGVVLEIQAGTRFVFQQAAYLDVGTSATLRISGTATKPVVFGPAQTGKRWGYGSYDYRSGGIFIESDASSNTSIKHLVLDSATTGIFVEVDGVIIDSSILSNNQFEGVQFGGKTVPGSLKGNTYANNGEYSFRLAFNALTALDGSGTFTGANTDIYVESGNITTSGTIPAPAAKYLIDGNAEIGGDPTAAIVTVAPGTDFKLTKASYIDVRDNGALIAVGTASQPIVFSNAVSGTTWGYGTYPDNSGGIYLNSGSSNLTHIANATFYGVVNNIPVHVAKSLTGVVVSPVTVLPGL